jgi:hypothetical protein
MSLAELEEQGALDAANAILCSYFLGEDWRAYSLGDALDVLTSADAALAA